MADDLEGAGGAGGGGDEGGAGGAAGGSGGGVAELLGGAGGGAAGGEGGEGGDGGQGGGDPWFAGLSDAPAGDQASNRAWAEKKGYKSVDAAIEALRQHESRFLSGDKLVVPKEGDPPEVFEKFYAATGRPESPDGYEVAAPEGHELDEKLTGRLRDTAHKHGVSKAAFEAMAAEFNKYGLELVGETGDQAIAAKNAATAELKSEWGDKFGENVEHANRVLRALELDMDFVGKMEAGLGTKETMQFLAKLGRGMGEDALLGSGGAKFAMSAENAQTELDAMKSGDKAKALMAGDKELKKRRDYLLQVVAAAESDRNRRAAMG